MRVFISYESDSIPIARMLEDAIERCFGNAGRLTHERRQKIDLSRLFRTANTAGRAVLLLDPSRAGAGAIRAHGEDIANFLMGRVIRHLEKGDADFTWRRLSTNRLYSPNGVVAIDDPDDLQALIRREISAESAAAAYGHTTSKSWCRILAGKLFHPSAPRVHDGRSVAMRHDNSIDHDVMDCLDFFDSVSGLRAGDYLGGGKSDSDADNPVLGMATANSPTPPATLSSSAQSSLPCDDPVPNTIGLPSAVPAASSADQGKGEMSGNAAGRTTQKPSTQVIANGKPTFVRSKHNKLKLRSCETQSASGSLKTSASEVYSDPVYSTCESSPPLQNVGSATARKTRKAIKMATPIAKRTRQIRRGVIVYPEFTPPRDGIEPSPESSAPAAGDAGVSTGDRLTADVVQFPDSRLALLKRVDSEHIGVNLVDGFMLRAGRADRATTELMMLQLNTADLPEDDAVPLEDCSFEDWSGDISLENFGANIEDLMEDLGLDLVGGSDRTAEEQRDRRPAKPEPGKRG